MKRLSNIAYTLVLAAAVTGCADYVDTTDFVVEKPESIKTYEYLDAYDALNSYVDRTAHPNFKLGVALNGEDYYNRSGLYALACANFDMATAYSELMYGNIVSDKGVFNYEPIRKFAEAAEVGEQQVFGHALTSSTDQNVTWLRTLLANAVDNLGEDQKIIDASLDYSTLTEFPYGKVEKVDYLPVVQDGVLVANKAKKFYLLDNLTTSPEFTYEFTIEMYCSKEASVIFNFGSAQVKIKLINDWQTVTFSINPEDSPTSLIFDPTLGAKDIQVKSVLMKHQRALTEAEKLAVYTDELDLWIAGAMSKSKGTIRYWDITNEPLANSGDDGEGFYPLLSAPVGSKTEFYWQDCLGPVQYLKITYDLATKYYAENGGEGQPVFFVNESCLDDVKKAESLLHWIQKWEAAGVKISGVGTKMHLECNLDADAQAKVKEKITKNLSTLAKSGKEVLISELDVVLVDETGASVATADQSLAQQKALGDFYSWIVKTYFETVPQAQQAGIILWSPADKGLWSSDLKRTPAFASFADALQGK